MKEGITGLRKRFDFGDRRLDVDKWDNGVGNGEFTIKDVETSEQVGCGAITEKGTIWDGRKGLFSLTEAAQKEIEEWLLKPIAEPVLKGTPVELTGGPWNSKNEEQQPAMADERDLRSEMVHIGGRHVSVEKWSDGEFVVRGDSGDLKNEKLGYGVVVDHRVEWGGDVALDGTKQEIKDLESALTRIPESDESFERNLKRTSGYTQLHNAVCDLLAELRIDEQCLMVMADGYSPDYPGGKLNSRFRFIEPGKSPCCKVQLSKVVARKLINAGMNDHLKEGTQEDSDGD